MNLIQTSQPASYPVSVSDVKLQLNIDGDDLDLHLTGLIAAATEHVETYIGRALIQRTYSGFANWWPSSPRGFIRSYVELEKPPLVSVTAVTTYDDFDVPTVMPAAQYYVDTVRPVGRVVLRRGQVWPIPLRVADGIQIDWTAGYSADASLVPTPIKLAILMVVGALNEQRGDETSPPVTPPAAEMLLSPYLVWPPS